MEIFEAIFSLIKLLLLFLFSWFTGILSAVCWFFYFWKYHESSFGVFTVCITLWFVVTLFFPKKFKREVWEMIS